MKNIFNGFLILSLLLTGCRETVRDKYITLNGFALGTTCHFVINAPDTLGLHAAVDSLFAAVNASMSVYEKNSLLNRINRNETDSLDRNIAYCIETAVHVSELSGGAYDITVKPLTQALGFNAEEAQKRPNIDSLLQYVGYRKIRIENGRLIKDDPGTEIDLNSIAKGYTVDLLKKLFRDRGATDFLIEVGGEVVCRGVNPQGKEWRIAIDKPEEGNDIPGKNIQVAIALDNAALATSGNYRKFYTDADGRKVVHTVNALNGESGGSTLLSATVVAPDCTLADACGTMLMVIGFDRAKEFLERHKEVAGYLIYLNEKGRYETYISPDLVHKIVNKDLKVRPCLFKRK